MPDDAALYRASIEQAARLLCGNIGAPCRDCRAGAPDLIAGFLDRLPGVAAMPPADLARAVRRTCGDA